MLTGIGILISISFALISIGLVMLVIFLIKLTKQTQATTERLLNDLHQISNDVTRLLDNLNEFMSKDLHPISVETRHLVKSLTELSTDVTEKSNSLNFLFKPLHFLNSKKRKESSSEPFSEELTLPKILGWIGSTIFLFKTTKELINEKKQR